MKQQLYTGPISRRTRNAIIAALAQVLIEDFRNNDVRVDELQEVYSDGVFLLAIPAPGHWGSQAKRPMVDVRVQLTPTLYRAAARRVGLRILAGVS